MKQEVFYFMKQVDIRGGRQLWFKYGDGSEWLPWDFGVTADERRQGQIEPPTLRIEYLDCSDERGEISDEEGRKLFGLLKQPSLEFFF